MYQQPNLPPPPPGYGYALVPMQQGPAQPPHVLPTSPPHGMMPQMMPVMQQAVPLPPGYAYAVPQPQHTAPVPVSRDGSAPIPHNTSGDLNASVHSHSQSTRTHSPTPGMASPVGYMAVKAPAYQTPEGTPAPSEQPLQPVLGPAVLQQHEQQLQAKAAPPMPPRPAPQQQRPTSTRKVPHTSSRDDVSAVGSGVASATLGSHASHATTASSGMMYVAIPTAQAEHMRAAAAAAAHSARAMGSYPQPPPHMQQPMTGASMASSALTATSALTASSTQSMYLPGQHVMVGHVGPGSTVSHPGSAAPHEDKADGKCGRQLSSSAASLLSNMLAQQQTGLHQKLEEDSVAPPDEQQLVASVDLYLKKQQRLSGYVVSVEYTDTTESRGQGVIMSKMLPGLQLPFSCRSIAQDSHDPGRLAKANDACEFKLSDRGGRLKATSIRLKRRRPGVVGHAGTGAGSPSTPQEAPGAMTLFGDQSAHRILPTGSTPPTDGSSVPLAVAPAGVPAQEVATLGSTPPGARLVLTPSGDMLTVSPTRAPAGELAPDSMSLCLVPTDGAVAAEATPMICGSLPGSRPGSLPSHFQIVAALPEEALPEGSVTLAE